uniref:Uncharacterized protein n=1 Tax=Lotharella oceanica TaxID=641309 RepID=A0A7S2TG95_9EUKA|mmetsp:Transcript_12207/g.23479  ORF Transcript_12207/g.23479 Transcript_12207/m.23479 type:complete len:341 (+) Transcript_12207:3-1025(+)
MFESTWNEPFALRRFPFDLQMLNLEFQCIVEGNIQVVLLGGPLFSAEFVPPQGEFQLIQFSESRARADGRILPYIASEELTNGGTKYTLTLFVQRSWFFYFHRVMLVLSLVCVTSVTAFLFVEVHEQMNFLVTVLLTIVAYLYFIDDYLPAVSYITMLDAYLYANTFFVMIVIVQCLALYLYYVDEEEDIVVPRLVRIVFFAVNFGIYVSLKAVALIYLFHCMQKDEPGILKLKQVIEKGPGRHRRSAIGSDLASSKLRRLMSTRKISLTVTELNRIIEGAAPNESDDDAEVEMITEEIREEGVSAGGVDESSSCGLDIKAATAGLLASSGGRRNDDTKR